MSDATNDREGEAQGDRAVQAVTLCADLHRWANSDFGELQLEMHELIDALNGEHEHSVENELMQIGAYAINLLRQMDNIPSVEWIKSEAERHWKERGE